MSVALRAVIAALILSAVSHHGALASGNEPSPEQLAAAMAKATGNGTAKAKFGPKPTRGAPRPETGRNLVPGMSTGAATHRDAAGPGARPTPGEAPAAGEQVVMDLPVSSRRLRQLASATGVAGSSSSATAVPVAEPAPPSSEYASTSLLLGVNSEYSRIVPPPAVHPDYAEIPPERVQTPPSGYDKIPAELGTHH